MSQPLRTDASRVLLLVLRDPKTDPPPAIREKVVLVAQPHKDDPDA